MKYNKEEAIALAVEALRNGGTTQKEVANKLGIPFRRLNEWLVSAGHRHNKAYTRKTASKRRREARRMFKDGASIDEIALRFSVKRRAVQRWVSGVRIEAKAQATKQTELALRHTKEPTDLKKENAELKKRIRVLEIMAEDSEEFTLILPTAVCELLKPNSQAAEELLVNAYLDGKLVREEA